MTIERRIIAAKKALRDATTKAQVLSVANRCEQLIKDCNQAQADEVSAEILKATRRFE